MATDSATYTVKVDGAEVEQTYTRASLESKGVGELRTLIRRLLPARTWVASARKEDLVQAILTKNPNGPDAREVPVPVPVPAGETGTEATAQLAAALKAIVGHGVDRAEVEAIIRQQITDDALLKQKVAEAVEAAVSDLPPVEIRFGGEVKKVDGIQHKVMTRLLKHAGRGSRTWVAGPAGSGKTYGVQQAAEALGLKVFLITPCLTRYDVLGYTDANGHVVDTQVSEWARYQGDKCLVLDEVDGWAEGAQLAANALLANGSVPLPDGRIEINPDGKYRVWIVATANTWGTGPNAKYVGRRKMDAAFLNRWDVKLHWHYDKVFERRLVKAHVPQDADQKTVDRVEGLVDSIQAAREYVDSKGIEVTISPRQSIAAAISAADGDTDDQIWDEIILGGLTAAQREDIRSKATGGA